MGMTMMDFTWREIEIELEKNCKADDHDNETIAIFTGHEGLKIRLKDSTSVLDFVELFFTEDIAIYDVMKSIEYKTILREKYRKRKRYWCL